MSEIRDTKESPGDVLVSREDLLRAANGTVGKLQAISGFLHGEDERLDISREQIAGMVEEAWRTLRDQIDSTPSIYYAGVGPGGSDA